MINQDTVAKNKLKYENTIFKTNMCGDCIVVEYRGAKDVTVRFEDTGFEITVAMYSLQKGEVKDRLKPSFYGVGVVGEAFIKTDPMYNTWMCMLTRCYGAIKTRKNSTYKDCTMSDNFRYYPYFKDWCVKQVGFGNQGWHLDKDILIKENKMYSEDTCCFVPQEINSLQFSTKRKESELPKGVSYDARTNKYVAQIGGKGKLKTFIGRYTTSEEAFLAYKEAKEQYIKEVANKWKDRIDPLVYKTLMNWEVTTND